MPSIRCALTLRFGSSALSAVCVWHRSPNYDWRRSLDARLLCVQFFMPPLIAKRSQVTDVVVLHCRCAERPGQVTGPSWHGHTLVKLSVSDRVLSPGQSATCRQQLRPDSVQHGCGLAKRPPYFATRYDLIVGESIGRVLVVRPAGGWARLWRPEIIIR